MFIFGRLRLVWYKNMIDSICHFALKIKESYLDRHLLGEIWSVQ